MREPACILHDEIEDIAVDDKITPSIGPFMDRVLDDFDAAEMRAIVGSQEFVMVAGYVDDARTLADLAQHLLDKVIV